MKRFAVLASCTIVCAVLVVTFLSTTATPSWSQLDQKVSVSKEPVRVGCYEKCSHQTRKCETITETDMCIIYQGSCLTLDDCIM